jgi:hypothetical protein
MAAFLTFATEETKHQKAETTHKLRAKAFEAGWSFAELQIVSPVDKRIVEVSKLTQDDDSKRLELAERLYNSLVPDLAILGINESLLTRARKMEFINGRDLMYANLHIQDRLYATDFKLGYASMRYFVMLQSRGKTAADPEALLLQDAMKDAGIHTPEIDRVLASVNARALLETLLASYGEIPTVRDHLSWIK